VSSFEQEFYRSSWQRVLPLGPYGVEPYLRTGRGSLPAGRPGPRRVAAPLDTLAQDLSALGRRAAIGAARRLSVLAAAPRR
jgi:hypothetical protein